MPGVDTKNNPYSLHDYLLSLKRYELCPTIIRKKEGLSEHKINNPLILFSLQNLTQANKNVFQPGLWV
jgi:hypothetical protein